MTYPRFASFTLGSWEIQILLSEPRGYLEELRVAGLFPFYFPVVVCFKHLMKFHKMSKERGKKKKLMQCFTPEVKKHSKIYYGSPSCTVTKILLEEREFK